MVTAVGSGDCEPVEYSDRQFWILAGVSAQDLRRLFEVRPALLRPTGTHFSPAQLGNEPRTARAGATTDGIKGESAQIDHARHVPSAVRGGCDADPCSRPILVVYRFGQQLGISRFIVRRLGHQRPCVCSLAVCGFDLCRDGETELSTHDIPMTLVGTDRKFPFTGPRMRLDYSEGCLLTSRVGVEYRRPVRRGTSQLDRGGAAKIGEANPRLVRPVCPRLLWQELAFKRESILERGAMPRALGGRAF